MKSYVCSIALGISVVAVFAAHSKAAPLFSDKFDDVVSAANYAVVGQTARSFPTFAWDYSVMGIPPAPNTTDGSTTGLKLDVNVGPSGEQAAAGLTLHTIPSFTGNYIVKFDAWLNVNGPFPGAGGGSTRFLTAGVGGDGTTQNSTHAAIPGGVAGSGGWVAVTGDGFNALDYRMHKTAATQLPSTGQFEAGTHTQTVSPFNDARNANDIYYNQFGGIDVANLPVQGINNGGPAAQTGTTKPGAIGMEWQEIELHVDATGGTGGAPSMKWYISGLLIGTLDAGVNGSFISDGRITLGFLDPTANVADAQAYNFVVIDNLRVVPEPGTFAMLVIALAGLIGIRRR